MGNKSKNTNKLTTNSDAAVLPGCVGVGGEAPGSLASIWVPAVVVAQAAIGVPAIKRTSLVPGRVKKP